MNSRNAMWVCRVYNIFLTPAHDWIHNCIQDWTRKWDPALNTSAVWTVGPQILPGIAHVRDGVWVGRVQGVLAEKEDGWLVGCVEGGSLGVKLETAWSWGHMMEFCFVDEWVWAWGKPWVMARNFWNRPYLDDEEGVMVGRFMIYPGWEIYMDVWLENFGRTQDGGSGRNFGWKVWKVLLLG